MQVSNTGCTHLMDGEILADIVQDKNEQVMQSKVILRYV